VRLCERNNSAMPKVSAEGGAGGAPGAGAEVPLQPMEQTMVRQAVPLQPMEVHEGAKTHLQPREDPTPEQGDVPEGGCGPVEIPRWSRLLAELVDPWREKPVLEQVCWQDLWPHGGPTLEQSVPDGLHSVEGTHAGAVHEEL